MTVAVSSESVGMGYEIGWFGYCVAGSGAV